MKFNLMVYLYSNKKKNTIVKTFYICNNIVGTFLCGFSKNEQYYNTIHFYFLYNFYKKVRQNLRCGCPCLKKFKTITHQQKVMPTIFWDPHFRSSRNFCLATAAGKFSVLY